MKGIQVLKEQNTIHQFRTASQEIISKQQVQNQLKQSSTSVGIRKKSKSQNLRISTSNLKVEQNTLGKQNSNFLNPNCQNAKYQKYKSFSNKKPQENLYTEEDSILSPKKIMFEQIQEKAENLAKKQVQLLKGPNSAMAKFDDYEKNFDFPLSLMRKNQTQPEMIEEESEQDYFLTIPQRQKVGKLKILNRRKSCCCQRCTGSNKNNWFLKSQKRIDLQQIKNQAKKILRRQTDLKFNEILKQFRKNQFIAFKKAVQESNNMKNKQSKVQKIKRRFESKKFEILEFLKMQTQPVKVENQTKIIVKQPNKIKEQNIKISIQAPKSQILQKINQEYLQEKLVKQKEEIHKHKSSQISKPFFQSYVLPMQITSRSNNQAEYKKVMNNAQQNLQNINEKIRNSSIQSLQSNSLKSSVQKREKVEDQHGISIEQSATQNKAKPVLVFPSNFSNFESITHNKKYRTSSLHNSQSVMSLDFTSDLKNPKQIAMEDFNQIYKFYSTYYQNKFNLQSSRDPIKENLPMQTVDSIMSHQNSPKINSNQNQKKKKSQQQISAFCLLNSPKQITSSYLNSFGKQSNNPKKKNSKHIYSQSENATPTKLKKLNSYLFCSKAGTYNQKLLSETNSNQNLLDYNSQLQEYKQRRQKHLKKEVKYLYKIYENDNYQMKYSSLFRPNSTKNYLHLNLEKINFKKELEANQINSMELKKEKISRDQKTESSVQYQQ